MLLSRLLYSTDYIVLQGSTKTEISGICDHSERVKPGDLFVCIKGWNVDSHCFVFHVALAGANCIVVERLFDELESVMEHFPKLTVLLVKDTLKALAVMASAFYGNPSHQMTMIGITGTKGKTTTAHMLNAILREAGIRSGMIGTLGVWFDETLETFPTTTPNAIDLHRVLAQMKQRGCTHVILEVSSQGLMRRRVFDISFQFALFTNLFPDHIGQCEHGSLEEYAYWKSTLFAHTQISILNRDAAWSSVMAKMSSGQIVWYSLNDRERAGAEPIPISMPGRYNQENALAAVTAAGLLGVSSDHGLSLKSLEVPGRTELHKGKGYHVIIDYAHNESSMENLLHALLKMKPRRLICVYGCGGNRSILRRVGMGQVGGRLADLSVLTEDNSRSEDLKEILDGLIQGIESVNGRYVVIPDRREAIRSTIVSAMEGDLIAVIGKGHETWQEIKGEKRYFSDRQEVLSAMEKRDQE